MQVLLTAATEMELSGFMPGHPAIHTLVTGVGVPSTLFQLTKRLHQIDYDLVIMAGIAGTFQHDWQPAEVVLVAQDCFGDLGAQENGHFSSIFSMGLSDPEVYPYTNGFLENPLLGEGAWPYRLVRGMTVNTISDDRNQTALLKSTWRPHIETMEGAALHLACLQSGVPFIQIRSISNIVGVRDKSQWKIREAVASLAPAIDQCISHYSVSH